MNAFTHNAKERVANKSVFIKWKQNVAAKSGIIANYVATPIRKANVNNSLESTRYYA